MLQDLDGIPNENLPQKKKNKNKQKLLTNNTDSFDSTNEHSDKQKNGKKEPIRTVLKHPIIDGVEKEAGDAVEKQSLKSSQFDKNPKKEISEKRHFSQTIRSANNNAHQGNQQNSANEQNNGSNKRKREKSDEETKLQSNNLSKQSTLSDNDEADGKLSVLSKKQKTNPEESTTQEPQPKLIWNTNRKNDPKKGKFDVNDLLNAPETKLKAWD